MKKIIIKEISIILTFVFLATANRFGESIDIYADEFLTPDIENLEIVLNPDGTVHINQYKATDTTDTTDTQKKAWNTIFDKYKEVLVGISGVLSLTFIVMFMKNIYLMATKADNPQERERYMKGVLWTGIGTAGFAAIAVLMAMAFKFFQ
jgi:hypothetical protein